MMFFILIKEQNILSQNSLVIGPIGFLFSSKFIYLVFKIEKFDVYNIWLLINNGLLKFDSTF